MNKTISIILSFCMLFSLVSLAGCGKNTETLKLGFGIHSYIAEAKNAKEDTVGGGEAEITVAAVLLDKNDKIVKCAIDSIENPMNFTADGKFEGANDLKSKYELGDSYGMKAYGGAKKEWYEQVDAFVSVAQGKSLTEIKALKGEDKKGTETVVNAGCTIEISDFVLAIEKAVNNSESSSAKADDTLKLGIVSNQTSNSSDASQEAEGVNEFETTVAAVALGEKGEITAAAVDSVVTNLKFDTKGSVTSRYGVVIETKKDAGNTYGMSQNGSDKNGDGKVLEWYEQANVFAASLVNKNAKELTSLQSDDGYGDENLQKAGCTIKVDDMVKAAVKAATEK